LSPCDRGAGIVFEDKIVGGTIPREFIPAIEKGVRETVETGPIAGYPVVDMKIVVGRRLLP